MSIDIEQQRAACARVARQRMLDHALAEVTLSFAERDVRSLLLKGPAIASWLYDDPGERLYDDVDLLVGPDQFRTAERTLAELGYESPSVGWDWDERGHHDLWCRSTDPTVPVELHRTLRLLPTEPASVWDRLSYGARSIEVAGVMVAAPSEVASALIVALHAAQHRVESLTSLEDLRRAVERVDLPRWQAAAALARELGAVEAFAVGLRADPAGRALVGQLGLDATGDTRLLRLRQSPPPPGAMGIEQLVSAHGARRRLRLIARRVVPSHGRMRAWLPLARRGRWGLFVAYVYRPLWLVAKLPRGLCAWLSAARPRSAARRRPGR